MKNRIITAIICMISLSLTLFSCSNKTQTTSPVSTIENEDKTEEIKPSYEDQIEIIAQKADEWFGIYVNTNYSYCVTDLDENGRLEIISSGIGGSGRFSLGNIYEVNSTFDGLDKCGENGSFHPDITLKDEIFCRIDPETGKIYYEVYDNMRLGYGMYGVFNYALTLENGKYELIHISFLDVDTDLDGIEYVTRKYHDDTDLTEEEYDAAYDTYFKGFDKKTVTLGWQKTENLENFILQEDGNYVYHKLPEKEELIANLTDSYNKFGIK